MSLSLAKVPHDNPRRTPSMRRPARGLKMDSANGRKNGRMHELRRSFFR
jgi:hypothetical protein